MKMRSVNRRMEIMLEIGGLWVKPIAELTGTSGNCPWTIGLANTDNVFNVFSIDVRKGCQKNQNCSLNGLLEVRLRF